MVLENKYLQIQGKVDEEVLHQYIGDRKYTKPDCFWFFVDYSPATFDVHSKFDLVLESTANDEIKITPYIYNVRLLNVVDQFGNHFDAIEKGWKSLCRFEFIDSIPRTVNTLPKLKTWKYNENSFKIANHKDIYIDTINPGKCSYTKVMQDFLIIVLHSRSINKKHFLTDFLKIYEENKEEMDEKIPDDLFLKVKDELQTI